eukprot:3642762-Pyramimonas_sp.AAC.2
MYLAFRQVLRDCLVIRWVECGSPRWPAHRAAQSVAPSPSPLDSVWLASGLCLCSCESLPQVEDPRALRGGHLDCRGTRPRSDYHPVRWCFLRPMRCAVVVSPVWEVAPFKIHVQEGGVLSKPDLMRLLLAPDRQPNANLSTCQQDVGVVRGAIGPC